MANRSRKAPLSTRLQDVEMIPITDPVKRAAIDRLFRDKKITTQDRRLLLNQTDRKERHRNR